MTSSSFTRLLHPLLGLVLSWLSGVVAAAPNTVYTVAIVPQFSPQQIRSEWQPLLDRVARESGVALELRYYPSIPAFEAAFLRGEPDFAFMNPYHAVMARREQGYIPLVRDRALLTGLIVVDAHGPFTTLQDLDGKKIAFPAPNAFGASLYMRALLTEEARIRFEPVYAKTHANVYRQVALGDVAAGGGVNHTFADQPPEIQERLRVLYRTRGAAPHPLCAHPRVPEKARKAVAQAFLRLADDAPGRALLREVRVPDPVAADYARDYAALERLHLDKYLILEDK